MSDHKSLREKLHERELYDEFCELMFAQQTRYDDLLEQLEKWDVSTSMGALSRFSDSQRSAWTLERAKRQERAVLEDAGLDLTTAQRKVVAERLFNLAASPHISDGMLLKMRDQEIKLEQLRDDKRRLDQADKKLEQAQQVIDTQRRKIEALEAEEAERKAAADAAVLRVKDGGASEETIKAVREALGMR